MADEETQEETTEAAETVEPEAVAEEPAAVEEPVAEEPAADEPAEAPAEPEAEAEAAEEPETADEPAAEPEAEAEAEAETPAEPEAPVRKKRKRLPRSLRHKHAKPARTAPAERKPITRDPKPETVPGRRQERRGVVVSDKGDKTIVVEIQTVRIHTKYKKVVRRSSKLHAHDESNAAGIGDTVRVVETRPLSKTKRWRLAEIVEKAK